MKQLYTIILSFLSLSCILCACTEHDWPASLDVDKEQQAGWGGINVYLQGSATTRATTSTITKEEADLFLVTIYKGEDLIAQQRQLRTVGSMTFPAGNGYRLTVENITEQDAEALNDGWGAKRYTGTSRNFSIQAGQTTAVGVNCTVANAAVAVKIDEALEGCTVTISDGKDRTLTTTKNNIAYFNVAKDSQISVILTVEKDGKVVSIKDLILEPAQVKDVNLVPSEPTEETGNIGITITYDDTFQVVDTDIVVE